MAMPQRMVNGMNCLLNCDRNLPLDVAQLELGAKNIGWFLGYIHRRLKQLYLYVFVYRTTATALRINDDEFHTTLSFT